MVIFVIYNMINGIQINLDIPYPPIGDLKPNVKLAYKLKEAYAGPISELSCITKYIFEHINFNSDITEIKTVLKKIAIIEMKHLDILGTMIKKLGISPTYTTFNSVDNESYWQSNLISYETDLTKCLRENIRDEQTAINLYKQIIIEAKDENITKILKRIILDEENHIKIFQSILNNLI